MLDGKVAIVTGGGAGIGRGIVFALAERGATVIAADVNYSEANKTIEELKAKKLEGMAVGMDTSVPNDVKKLAATTLNRFGRVDILVNNAGVDLLVPSADMSERQWDKVQDINLKGVFFCCKSVGKIMINGAKGKIINIASIAASRGIPGMAAYCASKAGVIALTRVLAIEWAKHNIMINAVSPGRTETALSERLRCQSPERFESFEKIIPLGRLAQVQDVASVVLFLASDDSNYITGQNFVIDGGMLTLHPAFAMPE
jgi:2-deoxy-D-gluconate 3-dehydrogenase